uniref:Adipokinetic hormone n=1 Tax=Helicoverpa zea TaxID=7113 RepID=AKH_HELZE|nr:RecName: Full=Adipokinetic hormone; AltName: Full=Hez-AKH [Helicoverpa zea]
QLTFTSSWG